MRETLVLSLLISIISSCSSLKNGTREPAGKKLRVNSCSEITFQLLGFLESKSNGRFKSNLSTLDKKLSLKLEESLEEIAQDLPEEKRIQFFNVVNDVVAYKRDISSLNDIVSREYGRISLTSLLMEISDDYMTTNNGVSSLRQLGAITLIHEATHLKRLLEGGFPGIDIANRFYKIYKINGTLNEERLAFSREYQFIRSALTVDDVESLDVTAGKLFELRRWVEFESVKRGIAEDNEMLPVREKEIYSDLSNAISDYSNEEFSEFSATFIDENLAYSDYIKDIKKAFKMSEDEYVDEALKSYKKINKARNLVTIGLAGSVTGAGLVVYFYDED